MEGSEVLPKWDICTDIFFTVEIAYRGMRPDILVHTYAGRSFIIVLPGD